MYRLLLLPVCFAFLTLSAQTPRQMNPKLGELINKSVQGEQAYQQSLQACTVLMEKADKMGGFEKLNATDRKKLTQCEEMEMKSYWDAVGDGCSWYCGGGPDSIYASSSLAPQSGIQYDASNAHDLSYKTAWVEGAPGNGVGEYLVYRFNPTAPRITTIKIVNGYVKSEKAWQDNARVKKLKMYINNKPFAILNLQDVRNEQIFTFSPIGNANREDWELLATKPAWTMKFEIMEVYKGARFEDCAISEIYFDGIDVHCFGKGTGVTMADGSVKPIEEIRKGDWVMSFHIATQSMKPVAVTRLIEKQHASLIKLILNDREIICTADHPFYTETGEWAAVDAAKANMAYLQQITVKKINSGTRVFIPSEKRFISVQGIEKIKGPLPTYTIELAGADNFIANGLLVKTEIIK